MAHRFGCDRRCEPPGTAPAGRWKATLRVLLTIPLAILLAACDGSSPDVLALRNATVIDVADGSTRAGQTLVIQGRRIVAMGPDDDVEIPRGGEIFDAGGGYLIPGLWDMHTHLFMGGQAPEPSGTAADAGSWSFWTETRGPLTHVMVAHGVTGIREMWGHLDVIDRYKAERAASAWTGPRVVASGHIIAGTANDRGYLVAPDAERAERLVDSLAAAGADFIKVYPGMSAATFSALARRARELGLPVSGHVDWELWLEEQIAAGQRGFSHAGMLGCVDTEEDWTDLEAVAGDYCRRALSALTSGDVWVTPTLTVFGASLVGPRDEFLEQWRYVPPFYRSTWDPSSADPERSARSERRLERFLSMVDYFHDRGVPMMVGTDVPFRYVVPGYAVHQELELLVRAGLTPLEALRSATLEPARFLEATDSLGGISVGKVADLVLLEENPLDDIGNVGSIHAVVTDGVLLTRARLDQMLATAAERFRTGESGR